MRVTKLRLHNFRSFVDSGDIQLDAINVLVGTNNAGKSSVLRGLYLMQDGAGVPFGDVRVGAKNAIIEMTLKDTPASSPFGDLQGREGKAQINIQSNDRRSGNFSLHSLSGGQSINIPFVSSQDPAHIVIPYLSKRKTASYNEDVRLQYAMQVSSNMAFLSARLSRISNRSFPGSDAYAKACEAILGFVVTAIPSDSGQRPGIYLPNHDTVPIDQMGEGVPNIVALLADLAVSNGKLFLVEEPENDLHPEALKALLELMIDSSQRNQFVVSTHSNIVVRYLGAAKDSRVYYVSAPKGELPTTAKIEEVRNSSAARLEVLRELGYSFSDFDFWDGWLILEESSAECIVRNYLIPWFAPKLSRVRTLAANGTGNVEATFADFDRLMRFTHLEPMYFKAAWVRVDADASGQAVVQKLRDRYKSWPPDHFACFSKEQFEHYYPEHFAERVEQTLAVTDRQKKREAKRDLLDDVRKWLDENDDRARAALEISAKEVIEELQRIEAALVQS
ncbi:AAA family ATPase [Burkholderia contaminans]|uniref:ATP-dependent nuclease n=1 Tax=Burkholderia contaminans TaxID=488447 RepID=UPI0018DCF071|nr:ATP-binding protein [Burkholderia contaminans]MBH9722851.1 AAA family ATPase [Burkholderia contaminans]